MSMPRVSDGGLTLVEAISALAVTTILAVAVGSAAHVILSSHRQGIETWRTTELGLALLEEVVSQPFHDPVTGSAVFGPESGEWTPGGPRSGLDDVDDYTVWDGSWPLQTRDGTALSMGNLRRRVQVTYVTKDDFSTASIPTTAYKRIRVTVLDGTETVATFDAIRVEGGRTVDVAY